MALRIHDLFSILYALDDLIADTWDSDPATQNSILAVHKLNPDERTQILAELDCDQYHRIDIEVPNSGDVVWADKLQEIRKKIIDERVGKLPICFVINVLTTDTERMCDNARKIVSKLVRMLKRETIVDKLVESDSDMVLQEPCILLFSYDLPKQCDLAGYKCIVPITPTRSVEECKNEGRSIKPYAGGASKAA